MKVCVWRLEVWESGLEVLRGFYINFQLGGIGLGFYLDMFGWLMCAD